MDSAQRLDVGDRMCISVELIRQWAKAPDFSSPFVTVKEIRLQLDGSKMLVLEKVGDDV